MKLTASALTLPENAEDLLVVLPSLGTAVLPLWQKTAGALAQSRPKTAVLGVDLPGHGNSAAPEEWLSGDPATTMAELADAVVDAVDAALADCTVGAAGIRPGASFAAAGDSIGGAIALQLALAHPQRITAVGAVATGALIGTADAWRERADFVQASGTPSQVIGSAERWFGPGFIERDAEASTALLNSLQHADRHSYAALCRALADWDCRSELGRIDVPVVAVAGSEDVPTPPAKLDEIASGVQRGRLRVLEGAAHLPPVEKPDEVAAEIARLLKQRDATSDADRRAQGMQVRRAVLSDAHVDRANSKITDFTADFQDFITRYAWGDIWSRPGLDRRMRSAVTLTAMVAGQHHEELAMHVRAALRNGLTRDEIKEILLQTAVYCSVPSANTAFKIASAVLQEIDEEAADI